MANTSTDDLYAQYHDQEISVSPFASAKMGLLPGQTSLRIDTYNIVCVPFKLSLTGAKLLASFSREEMVFFQRFVKGLVGLTVLLQPAASPQPLKIFGRCVLKSVAPMPGREAVGLIEVEWKPCPPDLTTMIGDYFMLSERLKQEYEEYKGQNIAINGDTSKQLGYNNFAELIVDKNKTRVAVFLLASDRADFLVPVQGPELTANTPTLLKLYFRSFQFSIRARITDHLKLPNGAQKVRASLEFSMELVDIIEHYRFSERFATKPEDSAAT
ncbi:MAG: hypothetical protein KKI09_03040 [Spirochaetes bacterium]|nr:hypothetical protein [Spirochaetota bacterium]MBU0954381.1 hypothetical protein [Spirochaetota bacterium]